MKDILEGQGIKFTYMMISIAGRNEDVQERWAPNNILYILYPTRTQSHVLHSVAEPEPAGVGTFWSEPVRR